MIFSDPEGVLNLEMSGMEKKEAQWQVPIVFMRVTVYCVEECLLKGAIGNSYRKISFEVAFIWMCIGLVLFFLEDYRVG